MIPVISTGAKKKEKKNCMYDIKQISKKRRENYNKTLPLNHFTNKALYHKGKGRIKEEREKGKNISNAGKRKENR